MPAVAACSTGRTSGSVGRGLEDRVTERQTDDVDVEPTLIRAAAAETRDLAGVNSSASASIEGCSLAAGANNAEGSRGGNGMSSWRNSKRFANLGGGTCL